MNRVTALAVLNAKILSAYSARTVAALRGALPLRLALPHLEPVLVLNLDKEIRKDTLVIRRAGAAFAAGGPLDGAGVGKLFAETRAIDGEFLARVNAFPVRVVIPYGEIEPLRTRRIHCLADAVYRTLDAWREGAALRAALRETYSRAAFERLAREVFDLYAHEVRALSRSVRLPFLLEPLRESFAGHLLEVMSGVGAGLARELAHGIHAPRRSRCGEAREAS
jgi:hypothetical protein